jgi:hypothetical protein
MYSAPTNSAVKNGARSVVHILRQMHLDHWIKDLVLVGTEEFLLLGDDTDLNAMFLDYRVTMVKELQVEMMQKFKDFLSPYEENTNFSEFKAEFQERSFEWIKELESGRDVWQILLPSALIQKNAIDFESNLFSLKNALTSFRELFSTLERPFDGNPGHFQALIKADEDEKNPQLKMFDDLFSDGLLSCLKATNRFYP